MRYIRRIIRWLMYGHAADSDAFIRFMRKKGCVVGERVIIYDPPLTTIDITRPWMISIGNDVKITRGVTILTHGYDWSVLKGVYGDILGSAGAVTIGNNVFIGMNATILKGTTIGNNVIIGAGSLVNKDVPNDVVVAGVPAKVIMTIDEYYEKRKNAQLKEAVDLILRYKKRYGKEPSDLELDEFFWLFEDDPDALPKCWKQKMKLHGNEELSNRMLKEHKKAFENKEELVAYADSL